MVSYDLIVGEDLWGYLNEITYVFDFFEKHYPITRSVEFPDVRIGYGCKKSQCDYLIPSHGIGSLHLNDEAKISLSDKNVLIEEMQRAFVFNHNESGIEVNLSNLHEIDFLFLIFCVISRIEEVSPVCLDNRGRYSIEEDAVYLSGFYGAPVVDMLSDEVLKMIFGRKLKSKSSFSLVLSHDVDVLLPLENIIRFLRNIAGDLVIRRDIFHFGKRIRSEMNIFEPWMSFSRLIRFYRNKRIKALFFFMGPSNDSRDAGYPSKYPRIYRNIVRKLQFEHQLIGVHPGVRSSTEPEVYNRQKRFVESMVGEKVTAARQHVLMFDVSKTPFIASSLGICSDFTLAYPEILGFRNGTSRGAYAYDFYQRQSLPIMMYSTSIVDFTLFEGKYASYTPKEVSDSISTIYNYCKRYRGHLVSLFHTGYMVNTYHKHLFDIVERAEIDGAKFSGARTL